MFVKSVIPRFVKNSRGERSIEIKLVSYEGVFKCSAPSGKSTGVSEVSQYHEKGIDYSMKLLRIFCKGLVNKNFIIKKIEDLKTLNNLMSSFEKRFGKLGGNVWYVIEGVFLKAAARDLGKEVWEFINDDLNNGRRPKMPMPVGNCIGGGLHSKKIKGKRPDFQEFLLIPDEKTFGKAITKNIRAYEYAKKLLAKPVAGGRWQVAGGFFREWRRQRNDEGAWMTGKNNEDVLEILKRVSKKYDLRIGLDVASSAFYDKGYYKYENKKLVRDKVDQIEYMTKLVKKFGIFYLEDPMDEGDFSGFKSILEKVKEGRRNVLVVGDDLTTTNLNLVQRAGRGKTINSMIIKPNQIGSILEVKKVVEYCRKNNIVMIFSHRSGETMDDILADYCVGFGGDFLKAGIWGKERLIKMKRVMDIEKSLK
jgi:enolase